MNSSEQIPPVLVIGAGLAGSEAAWQIARSDYPVHLVEMRPQRGTEAHKTGECAELVCSNSFRSDDAEGNAVGLLHEEMRRAGSLIMQAGDAHKLPAGGALAVDRHGFSQAVTTALMNHPNVTIRHEEITDLAALCAGDSPYASVIIATGPLTSPALGQAIMALTDADALAFFDAIAPIVHHESIDFDIAWMQSRYDKAGPGGTGADYINCPLNEAEYNGFIDALLAADVTEFKEWEKDTPYFNGCLPIEVMAARGPQTLRHGPMKPVGLTNAHMPGVKPYAVVQLRQDNALGTLWNMVGFQTKMKYGAQTEIFRMIPGLQNARFARLGGIHRNTFLNSPVLLDASLRLRKAPKLRFAGQITGVEGYVESAAMGLLAGRFAVAEARGQQLVPPPAESAFGALLRHITGGHISGESAGESAGETGPDAGAAEAQCIIARPRTFQPMNINFGLLPPLAPDVEDQVIRGADGRRLKGKARGQAKRKALCHRALACWDDYVQQNFSL